MVKFCILNSPTGMFLGDEQKPENTEEPYLNMKKNTQIHSSG